MMNDPGARLRWHVLLQDQTGTTLSHTTHTTKSSAEAEVLACRRRIEGGEPNAAGQVPAVVTLLEPGEVSR